MIAENGLANHDYLQEWDLVIVGAGIAGSSLAHSQAQVNWLTSSLNDNLTLAQGRQMEYEN